MYSTKAATSKVRPRLTWNKNRLSSHNMNMNKDKKMEGLEVIWFKNH